MTYGDPGLTPHVQSFSGYLGLLSILLQYRVLSLDSIPSRILCSLPGNAFLCLSPPNCIHPFTLNLDLASWCVTGVSVLRFGLATSLGAAEGTAQALGREQCLVLALLREHCWMNEQRLQ